MADYAVIETGLVANVVVWDGVADFGRAADDPLVPIDGLDPMPGIGWAYDGVTFTPPPIPPLPPDQQADMELSARKGAGIAITCTSDPAIDATYALDDRTVATVGSIARDVASGLDFPAGATTYDWPDIDGVAHTFTEPQWIALYKAMRDLVSALGAQRDIMAGGGSPVWPPQTATIA